VGHTLFFDTAVSRFHPDKETGEQPRVVRIAWWSDDLDSPVCHLIKPLPDTTIDPDTLRYHGLTFEQLVFGGSPVAHVIEALEEDAHNAEAIVSYNGGFHWRQLHRLMGITHQAMPANALCAMRMAEPILAIQAMRPGGGFSSPSLREACAFFDVPPPSGPDDPIELALSTVRAVRGVYEACLVRAEQSTKE
jgi:hypothetical protein